MKSKIDWKEMGQFNALLVSLYSAIAAVWKEIEVDLGIISWILDRGKEFAMEKIRQIGQEYIRQTRPLKSVNRVDLYGCQETLFSNYKLARIDRWMTGAIVELWFDGVRIPENPGFSDSSYRLVRPSLIPDVGDKSSLEVLGVLTGPGPGKAVAGDAWRANDLLLDAFLTNEELVLEDWKNICYAGQHAYFCFFGSVYTQGWNGHDPRDSASIRFMRYDPVADKWETGFISMKEIKALNFCVVSVLLEHRE